MRTAIILCIIGFFLVGCAAEKKKISWGKKCTEDGHWSFIWIEPVIGDTNINKENCKEK